jgi:hypothetical protein
MTTDNASLSFGEVQNFVDKVLTEPPDGLTQLIIDKTDPNFVNRFTPITAAAILQGAREIAIAQNDFNRVKEAGVIVAHMLSRQGFTNREIALLLIAPGLSTDAGAAACLWLGFHTKGEINQFKQENGLNDDDADELPIPEHWHDQIDEKIFEILERQ